MPGGQALRGAGLREGLKRRLLDIKQAPRHRPSVPVGGGALGILPTECSLGWRPHEPGLHLEMVIMAEY